MVDRGDLTPEQLVIAMQIASEANYAEPTGVRCNDGRTYPVGVGEALVGRRRFAERHGMGDGGRDRITRTLDRGVALGLWTARPAGSAPSSAPPAAPPRAPPPTLVSFKNDAEILFPVLASAPPSAPPLAPRADPIQQEDKRTSDGSIPSPSARSRATTKRKRAEADPRHELLAARLRAAFLESRGVPYGFGGRDAKAVGALLALSGGDVDEVDARWRRALALDRFPACGSLSTLASRWNDLAPRGPAGMNGGPRRNGPMPPSPSFSRTLEDTGP
jgi:hypothetical protein